MNTTPMKTTQTIVLPKPFNWKKTDADEVLEKTYEADTTTVYYYKKNLKAHYLDNKPVDIKLVRAMMAVTDACKNNFGVALGMYMNEIEWNNYTNYANSKYASTEATDSKKKQIMDMINNQVVTTFGNIVKDSFINAKDAEQRHMLRLVDDMAEYYCYEHIFSGYNLNELDESIEVDKYTGDTLHAIERLQMQMQKHLRKDHKLSRVATNKLSSCKTFDLHLDNGKSPLL